MIHCFCSFSRSLDLTWFSSEVEKINGRKIVDYYHGKRIVQWNFDVNWMCQTSKCKEIFLISRSYLSGDFFELRTWVVCSLQWNCSFLSAWVGSLVEHGTSNIFRWSLRQWQFWWGLGSHQTLETVALAGVGLGGIEPEIALEMLKLKILIWEDMYRLYRCVTCHMYGLSFVCKCQRNVL